MQLWPRNYHGTSKRQLIGLGGPASIQLGSQPTREWKSCFFEPFYLPNIRDRSDAASPIEAVGHANRATTCADCR